MEKPTFGEAFKFWLKLGFISFGGPAGQIAIMHEYLVEKKKWISESKFMHALNYCMVLPGPEAQQLATYSGWLLHGVKGGLVAGLLFILPSMFILLGLCIAYVQYGDIPWVQSLFNGLKPAVIAIVILALIKIGKKSLLSPFHIMIAAGAFVCIYFFMVPFPLIILGAILTGLILYKSIPSLFTSDDKKSSKGDDENEYYINKNSVIPGSGWSWKRISFQLSLALALWFIPMLIFYFTSDFEFWKHLGAFFTKAALVTFGGAYAVLPYVAQVSVEKFQWLNESQMMDGLALGETTPGPLIMILVFVGFMAGYHHFGNSLLMGSAGLFATTFYTFLPCFLFIFAGAPIIEKTQENKTIKKLLSFVTAAVVGVILNLTLYLGDSVVFNIDF
jgi:chromate transporter